MVRVGLYEYNNAFKIIKQMAHFSTWRSGHPYKFKLNCQTNQLYMQQQQNANGDPQPFDEKPIGQSQKPLDMMSEYPPDFNADQLNADIKPQPLPLAKRIHSKVWKIRKQAFQQLLNQVTENWIAYQEYFKDTVAFITDANPLCQERALKVLLRYLEASNCSLEEPRSILKALIQKCLVVEKGEITNLATEIMFWLMDHYPQVLLNEINENILNKNPKISASVLVFLEKLLNNYGGKKLKGMEEFSKNFTLLSNSVRPTAKAQSIGLFKQMFKWMGDSALGFSMHPEVKEQVVKFSKTYVKQPMMIKRGLNEDQKKGKKPIMESADDQENDEPQDVLVPYDSRWVDKVLQQPKWKDKKSILDQFIKKTKVKNIVPRQNTHYITLIKRLLSDNNINLLQCGFKVVKNLCIGLKKNFTHPCKVILSLIFSKLRDTKAMIVDEAQETLESMMNCLLIEDLVEDIKEGLKDKAPTMRFQTLKFIEKLVSKRDKKMMGTFKNLTLQIVDLNQDGASEVRDKALDVLCKMKASYGFNFFGDKLKKIQGKKLQTVQNYVDPNENKIDQEPIEQKIEQKKIEKKSMKTQSPQEYSQPESIKSSFVSEPVPKVSSFSLHSQFESPSQNVRLQAYQNLSQKAGQTIHQELIEGFKNKIPMVRQSNPNILKAILQCVKKSVHNSVGIQHMELLVYHDWKKCKPLLIQFIQNSKLNLMALEFVKNQGILAQSQSQPTKRGQMTQKSFQREINSNSQGLPSNQIASGLNPSSTSGHNTHALKTFYNSIQSLIPKMSNPDPVVRLQAAETALELLRPVPIGSPIQSTTEPTAATTEAVSQLFNVLKHRIQDSNEEISNNYINVITEMLAKGFLTKFRTPGRLIISMLLQKLNNSHLTNLKHFIKEMVTNHAVILWQFLATDLAKETMCNSVLNVIKGNSESFFKTADQKSFIFPLLTCISKDVEATKCSELLDQIVEINGEQSLEKALKEHKISSSFTLDNYLKKWHIHSSVSGGHQKGKPVQGNQSGNMFLGNAAVPHSKLERLTSQIENPWPLTPSSSHIFKVLAQMMSLGEPFNSLTSPTHLTDQQLSIVSNLRNELIEDYSDILTKWIFWRLHIEYQPKNLDHIFNLIYKMISMGFELQESEIVIILGALTNCLNLHKSQYLKQIIRINQLINQHPLYKEKAFRFWINSFNEPTAPIDQILNLIVNSCPDMIPSELVTLARFPAVVRNKEFNQYLRSNYNEKLLTVYGFKLQDISKNEQKQIISEGLNSQILTQVQAKYFVELFQRSSSGDLVEKITQETGGIPSECIMETHLKIMHSIIVPYLHRQLSFINVYNYFKHVQKIMVNANSSPFLLNLVRTLSFFLIDLDELKLENFAEMLKTINKLLLILLEISEPKHILEVLFIMMKQQLKINGNIKLSLLLPKCVGKVIKNPIFKTQYERSPENLECLHYIAREFIDILCCFDIGVDSSLMKTIKNLLNQMASLFPRSVNIFEEIAQQNQRMPERVLTLIAEITKDKIKENNNTNVSKGQSSFASSETSYVQSKDIKNAGNMMKALKSVVGDHGLRKPIEKQKMGE